MSERKTQLIAAAIEYLIAHGVADFSLRPLAAASGTSARLLLFHFGSKEQLLEDVLNAVQARLRESCLALLQAPPAAPGQSALQRFWHWAIDRRNLPHLRLLYEVHFIALQNPAVYGRYLERTAIDWVALIEAQLPPPIRSRGLATLCGAVFDGLLIELLGTGDRRRTTEALDAFVAMLRRELVAAAPPASKRPRKKRNP